ncbi:hypothetical protein [Catellatospora citrea]|nr:hypothetical protein [Catellatospora citrea]
MSPRSTSTPAICPASTGSTAGPMGELARSLVEKSLHRYATEIAPTVRR